MLQDLTRLVTDKLSRYPHDVIIKGKLGEAGALPRFKKVYTFMKVILNNLDMILRSL